MLIIELITKGIVIYFAFRTILRKRKMVKKQSETVDEKNFSIVLGGPFFQLLRKAHLTGNSLELLKQRIIIIALLAWLPLFVLSVIKGQAWGEGSNLPFIEDLEVHIRFLVAVPLMIIAEMLVHQRIRLVVNEFEERNLIPPGALTSFRNAISKAYRLRNSVLAEAFILILIYVIGYNVIWEKSMAVETTAWFSEPSVGKGHLSLAGIWFRYVSLPLFQFLFLRWYYRIFIWSRFLFQVSRIKLNLVPSHPDTMGGLGFLTNVVFAFMPLGLAHGAVMAGMISNHIFHEGASLLDFKVLIIIIVVWMLLVVMLPLLFFSSQLSDAQRTGCLDYGKFASRYVQAFDARMIKGKITVEESLSHNQEVQGLADLANSYHVVQKMQILPITRSDIIMLAVITVAPLLPLMLTMMPLSELIKMLSGVLF